MPKDKKEYMKKYNKEYYQKNKEKLTLKSKKYWQNNPGYMKEYRKNNPEYRKRETIYDWKKRGLICEDYDKLYQYYLSITECENCGIELNSGTGTKKCMDHCHDTGLFRNILCNTCNLSRY